MKQDAPFSFNSEHVPPSDRLKAFTKFSNQKSRRLLWKHVLEPLKSESIDLFSVRRKFGDEICLSNVSSTGHLISHQKSLTANSTRRPIWIGLVRDGEIEVSTAKETKRVINGDIFVCTCPDTRFAIGPSEVTHLLFADEQVTEAVSHAGQLLTFSGSTPIGQLLACTISSVGDAISNTGGLAKNDPLNAITKDVFKRVIEGNRVSDAADTPEQLRGRLRSFVLTHLSDSALGPGDLADFANMSRASLYRALAEKGGVASFILSIRLDVARSMLLAGTADRGRVCDVAYLCGFKSTSHFSTAFKRAYGMVPSDLSSAHGAIPLSVPSWTMRTSRLNS